MKFFSTLWILAISCVIVVSCSKDPEPEPSETDPPDAPAAVAAEDVSPTAFKAKWQAVVGVTTYRLDVSTDNFATFITGFADKEIKDLSYLITGLTPNTTYKYRVRSSNANGTSPNSNEIAVTTTEEEAEGEVVAKIDGENFIADEVTVTDTNIGLELHMTSGDDDITFRLSDKVAGSYTILNTVPTGRTAEDKTAMASWNRNDDIFYGATGSVTVTLSGDKITLDFTADAKNKDGVISKITNGKVKDATIKQPGGSNCKLATYTEDFEEDLYTTVFAYDAAGRLVQFGAEGSIFNFFWSKSKITRSISIDEDGDRYEEEWIYTGDKVTQINGRADLGSNNTYTYTITYTYTGEKLTKAERVEVSDDQTLTFTNIISYNGDNVSTIGFTGTNVQSEAMTFTEYDNKNNYLLLLAKATNNPLPIGFQETVDGEFLSKNNPITIEKQTPGVHSVETYEYGGYSSAGYPTSLVFTKHYDDDDIFDDDSYPATMTYIGCDN